MKRKGDNGVTGRPIIFGEVLFDQFPDGQRVLGGAPFNVAWHLQGFGLSPLFISRVGEDRHGRHVLESMRAWGMDTRGIQTDPDHPTGAVDIRMQGTQHTFDILPDQAYDHVEWGPVEALLDSVNAGLLYMGTLAAREPTSADTLARLRDARAVPVFVDINLRAPWWSRDTVETALNAARWAKLNNDELEVVLQRDLSPDDWLPAARELRDHHGLDLLVLTLASEGAWFIGEGLEHHGRPTAGARVVDTVGAGDAFAAVTLLGILSGWPLPRTLERALEFATRIVGQRGATALDPALYNNQLHQWRP